MKTLISMVDFVLEYKSKIGFKSELERLTHYNNAYCKYAKFLSKPLNLGMFVPCDEEGNLLQEPCVSCADNCDFQKCGEYQSAEERVLFEGFEVKKKGNGYILITNNNIVFSYTNYKILRERRPQTEEKYYVHIDKTIEDLVKDNLELTPTAIKEIGL